MQTRVRWPDSSFNSRERFAFRQLGSERKMKAWLHPRGIFFIKYRSLEKFIKIPLLYLKIHLFTNSEINSS